MQPAIFHPELVIVPLVSILCARGYAISLASGIANHTKHAMGIQNLVACYRRRLLQDACRAKLHVRKLKGFRHIACRTEKQCALGVMLD